MDKLRITDKLNIPVHILDRNIKASFNVVGHVIDISCNGKRCMIRFVDRRITGRRDELVLDFGTRYAEKFKS